MFQFLTFTLIYYKIHHVLHYIQINKIIIYVVIVPRSDKYILHSTQNLR
jgi:hypothetical protein